MSMAWKKVAAAPKPTKKTPAPTEPPKPAGRFMGLYKITYTDTSTGAERYGWAGTQADAKALAKTLGGTFAKADVPVDKTNLLAFLNENVTGKDEAEE
jgi:hypothetical protein